MFCSPRNCLWPMVARTWKVRCSMVPSLDCTVVRFASHETLREFEICTQMDVWKLWCLPLYLASHIHMFATPSSRWPLYKWKRLHCMTASSIWLERLGTVPISIHVYLYSLVLCCVFITKYTVICFSNIILYSSSSFRSLGQVGKLLG